MKLKSSVKHPTLPFTEIIRIKFCTIKQHIIDHDAGGSQGWALRGRQLSPIRLFIRRQPLSAGAQHLVLLTILFQSLCHPVPLQAQARSSPGAAKLESVLGSPTSPFQAAFGLDRVVPTSQASPQSNTFSRPTAAATAVARSPALPLAA